MTAFYVSDPDQRRVYQRIELEDGFVPGRGGWPATPPFIVHSKLGGTFPKAQPFIVRGVRRDARLLLQKIGDHGLEDMHDNYKTMYTDGTWHEEDASYTVEGRKFNMVVRKMVLALLKTAREARKVRAAVAKEAKAFDDRGIRCGVCPVCFGDYVVTFKGIPGTPEMVHHGYQRPGHGYIVGDCHGVAFEPFEVSCKGTESWLAILKSTLADRQKSVRGLPALTEVTVQDGSKYIDHRWVPQRKLLKKGEPGFDDAIAGVKRNLEQDIRHLGQDIKEYAHKIATWQPATFPRVKGK